MNIKNKICHMFNTFTISFTVVMIVYPIFSILGYFSALNDKLVLQILAMCFGVSLVQFLTNLINIESDIIRNAVQFLDMYVVIMLFGALVFRIFPISLRGFIIPLVFGVIIFAAVWIITYISAYRKIQEINRIIQERK